MANRLLGGGGLRNTRAIDFHHHDLYQHLQLQFVVEVEVAVVIAIVLL